MEAQTLAPEVPLVFTDSAARKVRDSLQRSGNAISLEVSDDGVGIAQASGSAGLGLHHIQARAVRLRGRASVRAAPNQGTRIAVEFPHRA